MVSSTCSSRNAYFPFLHYVIHPVILEILSKIFLSINYFGIM